MALGPLARVGTQVAAVNLNVGRALYWGKGIVMELLVPDQNAVGGLRIEKTLVKDFNRITGDEATQGDGQTVVYQIADTAGNLETTLRMNGLIVRVDGMTSEVKSIPLLAPNEAKVFTLTCKVRTLLTEFDKR